MQLSKTWFKVSLTLLLAIWLNPTIAQTQECKKPKVFFINGVFNQQWEAQEGARRLEGAIKANGGPQDLHITTLYNPTDTYLGDALEIAQDAILSENHLFYAFVAAYSLDVATAIPLRQFASWLTDDATYGRSFTRWLNDQISDTAPSLRNEAVISKIQRTLRSEVENNKNAVVVVAHSEGNFYLNEAIRRLKTDDATKDIPGIQAIGVFGIGVASRLDLATLPSGQDMYRYITKDDDEIIVPLNQVLAANFTHVVDTRVASSTLTHHELITDYLYENVTGNFNGNTGVSIRKTVADEFNKVYHASSESFPCISDLKTAPESIIVDQPVLLTARVRSRLGASTTSGAVSFTDEASREFCASTTDAAGEASCSYVFHTGEIPSRISAKWTSSVFQSDKVDAVVTSQSYWYGTMQIDTCTALPTAVAPSGYTQWLYENPCFTAGPSSGQYKGFISFKDGDPRVVLGSNFGVAYIFTTEDYSATFNLNWKSTDSIFYFEVPVSAPQFTTIVGNRRVTLTVTQRTSTRLLGTVSVESPFGVYYKYSNTDVGIVAPTNGVGTFELQLKEGVISYP